MREEEMELTAKQLAEAFGVKPGTVSSWKTKRGLKANKPGGANRLGLRARIVDVREFIGTLPEEDREYTRQRFEMWLEQHREEVIAAQSADVNRTLVLSTRSA